MSVASEMQHESPRRNVVAVIGDASIGGGFAFEGINNAANTPNNLLIILNDNDMFEERAVYDMAQHLFEKAHYHGKTFAFRGKMHISRIDARIGSNMDIYKKYLIQYS